MKKSNWYKNLSFRYRLILWLLLVSFIPTILIGISSTFITLKTTKQTYENSLYNKLKKATQTLQAERSELVYSAIKITFNELTWGSFDTFGRIGDPYQLQKVVYASDILTVAHSIYFVSLEGDSYAVNSSNEIVQNIMDQSTSLFEQSINQPTGSWGDPIVASNVTLLPYIRRIKDYYQNKVIGILICCVDEKDYASLMYSEFLDLDQSTSADNLLLINSDNTICSSWAKDLIGKNLNEAYGIHHFSGSLVSSGYGNKNLFVSYSNPLSPYEFISVVDYGKISLSAKSVLILTGILLLVCLMCAVVLSILVSKGIIRPITNLTKAVDALHGNNLNISYSSSHNDEISSLGRSFVDMTKRLKLSIEHDKKMQKEYQLAEYRALSAQINPHFLYNTISTIIWLINTGQKEESIQMLMTLSALFKTSVTKTRLIPIKEELEHVRNYLELQKMRYKNQFEYIIDVKYDLLNYYTVKIILQPLVENAIYHGVRESGKHGLIQIIGRQLSKNIVFSIIDNGRQLTVDQIEKINHYIQSDTPDNSAIGIGLKNVHDRIMFHYGEGYGVKLLKDGDRTIAQITIKAIKENDKDV